MYFTHKKGGCQLKRIEVIVNMPKKSVGGQDVNEELKLL